MQTVMHWLVHVSLLELIVKGFFVGVVASAPMGPVGVLCIQRTLQKGRIYGIITGIGAAVSDILYAIITGFGMSFVMDFVQNKQTLFFLQLVGSVMLFFFGIYMFRSDPHKCLRPVSRSRGTLLHNGVTAFLVTFSNPLIIFLFIALFARFAFVIPDHPFELSVGYLSIFGGALAWWLALTYFVNKVRKNFNVRGIRILNRTIGSIVLLAAMAGLIWTLSGLHSPYQ